LFINTEKLEFKKIKNYLKNYCNTDSAKKLVEKNEFSTKINKVKSRIEKNSQFRKLLLTNDDFFIGNLYDLNDFLKNIKENRFLQLPKKYKNLEYSLRESRRLKSVILKLETNFNLIKNYENYLYVLDELTDLIESKIDEEGEIKTNATKKLLNLTNKKSSLGNKLRNKLNQSLKKYNNKGYLQDNLYTSRNDRYVLPVKSKYRERFKGIVQGSSTTGNTLYIEPMEIVEINNELSSTIYQIEEEKKKIIFNLGEKVKENYEKINLTFETLYDMDFEIAKSKYTIDINAEKPEINDKGIMELYQARHPMLEEDEVVPIDLWIKEDKRGLVITGPNAGGKTVSLKTAGIITLMAMYGLMVPAKEWSKISIFKNIFVDIGDTQSIEQNLSTFSGHITNFVEFVKNVDENTLILMDEVGAGTDPEEGASLAMSLIDYFMNEKAKVIVTTHYNSLKRHSIEDERLENASCMFDYDNIEPLYKIKVGIPGSSSGLLVAEKLGLPKKLINKAKSFMNQEHLKLEKTIADLEKKLSSTEDLKEKLKRENEELQKKMSFYEEELEKITQKRTRKKMESLRDFENEFFNLKDKLNNILNEIHKKEKELENKKQVINQKEAREKFDKAIKKVKKERAKVEKKMEKIENPKVGDEIFLEEYNIKGKIIEIDRDKNICKLNCNSMIVNVKLDNLIGYKIDKNSNNSTKDIEKMTNYSVEKTSKYIGNELVVVGLIREDAIDKVGDFISHAILEGYDKIKIVHGLGTGVLREAIHDYLKKNPNIKNYFYEDQRGVVTIAEL